jgi:hypothetical protein
MGLKLFYCQVDSRQADLYPALKAAPSFRTGPLLGVQSASPANC